MFVRIILGENFSWAPQDIVAGTVTFHAFSISMGQKHQCVYSGLQFCNEHETKQSSKLCWDRISCIGS